MLKNNIFIRFFLVIISSIISSIIYLNGRYIIAITLMIIICNLMSLIAKKPLYETTKLTFLYSMIMGIILIGIVGVFGILKTKLGLISLCLVYEIGFLIISIFSIFNIILSYLLKKIKLGERL
ncbi:hypothetical protein J2S18_001580 [Eubacterium multiforme]|uniref:4 TMS phage holin, superfamily IV n=1 Tax=Eubacterium multiforme TaxID=83339 RepID=A0ABT9UTM6_9FIRM|nr:hypothetical protein [Eubacterium multiforme]